MNENRLLGTWKSDPDDPAAGEAYGPVTLKFGTDGTLIYIAHGSQCDQIIRLTYHTEPGVIITDQSSHPRFERTSYEIGEDGTLTLELGGQRSRYTKVY